MRRRRPSVGPRRLLALAACLSWLAACGGDERHSAATARTEPVRVELGRGASGGVVLRPRGRPSRPAVVFLHGWGALDPRAYAPWLRHLVRRGSAVVYPRYQSSGFAGPGTVLPDALRGIRLGLERLGTRRYLAVGHSAGAALAADVAAAARRRGLPAPLAVFAAYPGRAIRGLPLGIPQADLARIPAGVRIVALAGARDAVVGSGAARAIVRAARGVPPARRSFVLVSDPEAAGHLAPQDGGAAARRAFWTPLDRLIDAAAG